MRIRSLRPEEFPILKRVADGIVPPHGSVALLAEDNEEVVGRIFLMAPVHIEGTWVREDHRRGSLLKRLFDRVAIEGAALGIHTLFAYAPDATIADYLCRLGYRPEPWTVWRKDI